ncbi:MAG: hypothetical protein K2L94_04725 [Alphaproteobacteria bacterium]|nr:hypothetical protein [Alphaproteobacteria bacterium]
MKKYKVINRVVNDMGLSVALGRRGRTIVVYLPSEFRKCLPAGTTVWEHENQNGYVVAYSFGGQMYFLRRPTCAARHREFLNNFRGMSHGCLDRVYFKIALARAVLANGGQPTWSAVKNFAILDRLEKRTR